MELSKHDLEYLASLEKRYGKGEKMSKRQMIYFQEKHKFEMEQLQKQREKILDELSNPSVRGKERAELLGQLQEIEEKIEENY